MTRAATDFDSLANLILSAGGETSPSELHGFVCGLLAAGARPDKKRWGNELVEFLELEAVPAGLNHQFLQMAQHSLQQLRDNNFDFQPLLSESAELSERTQTLGHWCQDFLHGFGVGDYRGELPPTSSEALSDIGSIGQVDVGQIEETKDAENQFAQVLEYVRVAVLNIFTECSGEKKISTDDNTPTVH